MLLGGARGAAFAALALAALGSAAMVAGSSPGAVSLAGSGELAAVDKRGCIRPYAKTSPWNTKIPRTVVADGRSDAYIASIRERLSSDPTQYTYPVYYLTKRTPRRTLRLSGWFSHVGAAGKQLRNQGGGTIRVPLPRNMNPAKGTDAQVVLLDLATGDEWGFWELEQDAEGEWTATNGYRYNTRWSAVPPARFVSRGAGVPYLAGLVRPCEIARKRIDHALAFAYNWPNKSFVFPATKSDGKSSDPASMPEGTRVQLDPRISVTQIREWGCTGPCLTIARALQDYGMYVIDNAGRPKVMLEYEATARWRGIVNERTVRPIPVDALRVVPPPR